MSETASMNRPNRPAPPSPLSPEQLRVYLEYELESDRIRGNELLAALERTLKAYPTIETDEQQGIAAENRRLVEVWLRHAEDSRKIHKAPLLALERTLDGWFAALRVPFENPLTTIKSRMDAYANKKAEAARAAARAEAERKRLAAEEASRKAQEALEEQARQAEHARQLREAEEAQRRAASQATPTNRFFPAAEPVAEIDVDHAAQAEREAQQRAQDALQAAANAEAEANKAQQVAEARPAAFTRTTGAYGSTVSVRRKWEPKVFDEAAVPRQYLAGVDLVKVRRAGAAADHAPDGKPLLDIPGIRWIAIDSTQVRGA